MLGTVLLGIVAALLLVPFGRLMKGVGSLLLVLVPAALLSYYLYQIPAVAAGSTIRQVVTWIPSLGVNLDFLLDGLSLLFILLITGIGTAIFFYARSYLKGNICFDRFFGYLLLFMASMLGLVLSNNLILLFVFWELTSITSFFLIGFDNDNPAARKSALTALSITGMGGFFLLAGLVLLGNIADTYTLSELIQKRSLIQAHSLYPLVLFFIFIGAFTKSAQFPFHFWLPGAMKAPTPVSAYLHSATLVKAGIYLLARFNPILGETDLWCYTLMAVGGFTMLSGAFQALRQTDLKSILAYSTISALGMLTFLIGVDTKEAIIAACVFVLVHALYKAALFLVTGIIDHETKTRNVLELSGLRKVLLPVAIAGLLAALSSAGLPLTFGFVGKDLIYEATLHGGTALSVWLTVFAVATNVGLVTAGFVTGIKPFVGPLPAAYREVHLPNAAMWVPPLLLALVGLVLGCAPAFAGQTFLLQAANVVYGSSTELALKIWHGFNLVLMLSLGTLLAGTVLYFVVKPSPATFRVAQRLSAFSAQAIMTKSYDLFLQFSKWYTGTFLDGYLRSYHLKIILFAEALLTYKLWLSGTIQVNYRLLNNITIYEVAVVVILIGALVMILRTTSRLTAVLSLSVIGYCICLIFVFYSAPDLAMTQFAIDTLTTVLFVLVLYRLPGFLNLTTPWRQKRDITVSVAFGVILALVALQVHHEPIDTATSDFYGANAYKLAKGKNVVNVILVDFRGMDTMFETVVLSIAAIGVYNLLTLRLKPSEKE